MTATSPLLGFETSLQGRRVLVTGHTGFYRESSARELAQAHRLRYVAESSPWRRPPSRKSVRQDANIGHGIASTIGDIRDFAAVRAAVEQHQPSVIIHLQPRSRWFRDPSPIQSRPLPPMPKLGTAHVLESGPACCRM